MNNFLWLIRRELWEHKAIWIAPAIVLGCIFLTMLAGRVHISPFGVDGVMPAMTADQKTAIMTIILGAIPVLLVFCVMGIIAFFYCIDALYADRRDRSVLFWKSLPLSDAETVMSKFAVAAVVIPLIALAATLVTQLMLVGGESVKASFAGTSPAFEFDLKAILGAAFIAIFWCVTAMLWYAPFVGYLMLASAWAPRAPFLWAVLPPAGLWILEAVVMRSEVVGDFISDRLLPLRPLMQYITHSLDAASAPDASKIDKFASIDLNAAIVHFYRSPELWLGLVAAAALLAAAMWVRRYRDETA